MCVRLQIRTRVLIFVCDLMEFFFSKNDYEFTEKEEKNRHIPIL